MHLEDVEQVVGDDKQGEGGQGGDSDDDNEEQERVVISLGCCHLSPQLSTLQTVMVSHHPIIFTFTYLASRPSFQ